MKVVNLASAQSAWRGYEYYQDGHKKTAKESTTEKCAAPTIMYMMLC